MQRVFFCLCGIACFSISLNTYGQVEYKPSLAKLTTYMSGSFNSARQHKEFPEDFYDITLHMSLIWPERCSPQEAWLYVEQSVSATPDKPYRQRVYRLRFKKRKVCISSIFNIPDAKRFVGAWAKPSMMDVLKTEELTLREGCDVELRLGRDGVFRGGNDTKECASELKGAKYVTARVYVHPDRLESWDRGFDAAGVQVWGATKGAYEFDRQAPITKIPEQ